MLLMVSRSTMTLVRIDAFRVFNRRLHDHTAEDTADPVGNVKIGGDAPLTVHR